MPDQSSYLPFQQYADESMCSYSEFSQRKSNVDISNSEMAMESSQDPINPYETAEGLKSDDCLSSYTERELITDQPSNEINVDDAGQDGHFPGEEYISEFAKKKNLRKEALKLYLMKRHSLFGPLYRYHVKLMTLTPTMARVIILVCITIVAVYISNFLVGLRNEDCDLTRACTQRCESVYNNSICNEYIDSEDTLSLSSDLGDFRIDTPAFLERKTFLFPSIDVFPSSKEIYGVCYDSLGESKICQTSTLLVVGDKKIYVPFESGDETSLAYASSILEVLCEESEYSRINSITRQTLVSSFSIPPTMLLQTYSICNLQSRVFDFARFADVIKPQALSLPTLFASVDYDIQVIYGSVCVAQQFYCSDVFVELGLEEAGFIDYCLAGLISLLISVPCQLIVTFFLYITDRRTMKRKCKCCSNCQRTTCGLLLGTPMVLITLGLFLTAVAFVSYWSRNYLGEFFISVFISFVMSVFFNALFWSAVWVVIHLRLACCFRDYHYMKSGEYKKEKLAQMQREKAEEIDEEFKSLGKKISTHKPNDRNIQMRQAV